MSEPLDPALLTARLIRCPSVTPDEGGAIRLLERMLDATAPPLRFRQTASLVKLCTFGDTALLERALRHHFE